METSPGEEQDTGCMGTTLFVVAATAATEDGGPFTVHRADGMESPKNVHRRKLDYLLHKTIQFVGEQCAQQDSSSTDTNGNFLFLLNPRRTSAVS